MRILKLLLKIVLVLLALVLIGLAVFAALFDPNDYRDRVAGLVRQETGRELVLAGPLELSLFPWLAVEAENVSLGNAPGFGDAPMLRVARMSVGLQLLPLLSGELRVGEVRLDGLDLSLARDAGGRTNWDDLLALAGEDKDGGDAAVAAPRSAGQAGDEGTSPGPFRLTDASLDGLVAEHVRLLWDDRASGARYELSGGELRVGAVRYGAPLDLEAAFDFRLADPELRGRFRLEGNLAFDLERGQYAVPRLTLALDAEGRDLPGGRCSASMGVDQLRADLDKGTASASAFTLLAYGAQVSGSVSLRDLFGDPAGSGVLELKRCDARKVLAGLGLELPETRDPKALSEVGGTLRFDYAENQLGLPYLSLDVDGAHLEGDAAAGLERPTYALHLTTGDLDLDRYLPPRSELVGDAADSSFAVDPPKAVAPAGVAEGDANASAPDPEPAWLDQARRIELDAALTTGAIRLGGMDISGLSLKLRALHGVVAVEPLDLRLTREGDSWRLVTGKVFGDLRRVGMRADDFTLTAPGGGVSGSLAASNLLAAPEATGKLSLDHLDLRRLARALADLLPSGLLPETRDPKALTDLNGQVEFRYDRQLTDVPAFDLRLDGSTLKGRFLMRAQPEEYVLDLKADTLDLDRYLPPRQDAERNGDAAANPEDSANATIADAANATQPDEDSGDLLARLRALRADADVRIDSLTYDGLSFTDIAAKLHARDGKAELDTFRASLGEGALELAGDLDATGDPRSTLSATIRGLKLGPLLQRFAGIEDVKGTLTLRTIEPLSWTGLDAQSFKRSFSGSAGFAVRDGQYPGLNLFKMLTVVDQLTTAVLEGGADERTKFGEITGTVVARKGRVNCDDLCVKAPGLRAGGAGFVNLPDGRIDYLVRAMAVPDAKGQGGAPCDDYYGVTMPLRVTGTLDEPHYRVSAEEYAASVARGAVGLLGGVVKGGAQAVGAVLGAGSDAAQDAAQGVVEGGKEAVQNSTEAVGSAVEDAAKGGAGAVEDFIDTLRKAF